MKGFLERLVLAIACGVSMGIVVLIGLRFAPTPASAAGNTPVSDVIRAHRFELIGEKGNVIGTFAPDELGEPNLCLFGAKGKIRGTFSVPYSGPELCLYDTNGKVRGDFRVSSYDGEPDLCLYDAGGHKLGAFGTSYGEPVLHLYDANDKVRAAFGISNGEPNLQLNDEKGNPRLQLGATSLYTKATDVTTNLPVSSMVLFDKDGKVTWQAPPLP